MHGGGKPSHMQTCDDPAVTYSCGGSEICCIQVQECDRNSDSKPHDQHIEFIVNSISTLSKISDCAVFGPEDRNCPANRRPRLHARSPNLWAVLTLDCRRLFGPSMTMLCHVSIAPMRSMQDSSGTFEPVGTAPKKW